MPNLIRTLSLLVLLTLGGCETLSRSECATGDWYSIGMRDGANGHTEDRFLDNAKACAEHGVQADRERWLEGRERGLERYCTARNAFGVGAQNAAYQGVCTGAAEEDFQHGYQLGRALAEARSRRSHWGEEIHRIHQRLDEADSKGDTKKTDHAPLTDVERVELGFRLGVAVTRHDEAERDCAAIEQRGSQL